MLFFIGFFLTSSVRSFDIPPKSLFLATLMQILLILIFCVWLEWGVFGAAIANSIHLTLRFLFCYFFILRDPELGPIVRESYSPETF